MTAQMLIYETVVPVSNGRHGKCSIEASKTYAFARHVNSVPLMAVEFPQAAPEYAIVFAANGDEIVPVVILGARKDENLYVQDDAAWAGNYIPAFVRRYPFVFSTSDDGKTFTLCVDEAFPGLNYQGKGQALFTDDGKHTPYVDNVLKFLQEYRAQFVRTQAFCRKLKALDLLEPMQAQFSMNTGEKMSLGGFLAVNRQKLKALAGETLAELARTDELELIYLHLQSMRNFTEVKNRLVLIQGGKTESAAPTTAEPSAAEPTAEAVPAAETPAPAKASGGKKR